MTEPNPAEEPKRERRVQKEVKIDAPIEEVWKALTDADAWESLRVANSIISRRSRQNL